MKQILTAAFMLFSINAFSQDTTGVMITLEEVIFLDYKNGLEILDLYTHDEIDLAFTVKSNEVLCLHFYDNKKRYRNIISIWDDGYESEHAVYSKDKITCSKTGYGGLKVIVSEPRKKK
jgi:hypothetical protein